MTNSNSEDNAKSNKGPVSDPNEALIDELGIEDISVPLVGGHGRLFSVAGRQSPVVEFQENFVVMHPPQKPFAEQGPTEEIMLRADAKGILLDVFGKQQLIIGARFQKRSIFWLREQRPGTSKHFVGWFDDLGKVHSLYFRGIRLTADIVTKMRNSTHDGEISGIPDLTSD